MRDYWDVNLGVVFMGLDLGKQQDHTALCVNERLISVRRPHPVLTPEIGWEKAQQIAKSKERREWHYYTRVLKRWELGTPYTAIATELASKVSQPPYRGCVCGVDVTGVGLAVLEIIVAKKPACRIVPIHITAGSAIKHQHDGWHVAKKQLASTVLAVLQTRRIQIAKELEHATTIETELGNFKVKITAALNETFESWREAAHDDLVLAEAISLFLGERMQIGTGPLRLDKPGMPNPYEGKP